MSTVRPFPVSDLRFFWVSVLLAVLSTQGCGRTESLPPEDPGKLTVELSSSAFAEGGMIPKGFTCDGSDRSPPLAWSAVPSTARSLALICDDPDAPSGTWSHWVAFNLPPHVKGLTEGVPPAETIPEASIVGADPSAQEPL